MSPPSDPLIYGMDLATARRYTAVMDRLTGIADRIHALADMMSRLQELPEGQVQIKPGTIGYIGKMITTDVLWMISHLDDDFACSADVASALKQTEDSR